MNFIYRNTGVFLQLVMNTLDRKPVTDTEARENYKSLIIDYYQFLLRLSSIHYDNKLNIKLWKQWVYLSKLDALTQRYKSIGNDTITDDKVEDFLIELQEHMREWINNDYLETDLRSEETKYFSKTAYEKSMQQDPIIEIRKAEAINVFKNSARNRVDF
jgi:hypothetical protein